MKTYLCIKIELSMLRLLTALQTDTQTDATERCNEINNTSGPVSSEMGDRVLVQFPVLDINFGM